MSCVNLAIVQLQYAVQMWPCFVSPTHCHERMSTHGGQPDLDIKS